MDIPEFWGDAGSFAMLTFETTSKFELMGGILRRALNNSLARRNNYLPEISIDC